MRLVSFRDGSGDGFGVVDDDGGIIDVGRKGPYTDLRSAIAADALAEYTAASGLFTEVQLPPTFEDAQRPRHVSRLEQP